MNAEKIRALHRAYVPGRRVRFRDAEDVRRKTGGAGGGILLSIVPLPSLPAASAPDRELPEPERYGVAVEYRTADGGLDTAVLPTDDVDLGVFDAGQIRAELTGRQVEFAVGDSLSHGRITEVFVHEDADPADPVVTLIVRRDTEPADPPDAFATDFTRCTLRLRASSP